MRLVLANAGEVESNMLDFVRNNQSGIYINDSWYDWPKIKAVFEAAEKTGDAAAVETIKSEEEGKTHGQ